MKKNYDLRRIKAKKSYSTTELAEVLQVHVQTVRGWRKSGLKPIDSTSTFMLFYGSSVREFLKEQQQARKVSLLPHQFYCLGCHSAVEAVDVRLEATDRKIGEGQILMAKIGKCSNCKTKVWKYTSQTKEESVT